MMFRSITDLMLGRQNYPHQVSDQALYETYPLLAKRSSHGGDLETATAHVHRMPRRFSRQYDGRLKGRGYCSLDDRRQLWV
jgi:hypothetical protein